MNFNEMISQPVGDKPPPNTRHIAVVGASGSGKTTWSCQAKNCLVILTESQAEGRVGDTNKDARVVVLTQHDPGGSMTDFEKMNACIDWLQRDLFSQKEVGWVPSVIVVDSFTELFRMVADYVSGNGTKSWTFDIWKKYSDLCMRLVRKFRDMGPMVVGVFLDEISNEGEGQKPIRRMSVGQKSLSNKIGCLFDMVFWTEVVERGGDETVYAIRTVGGTYDGLKLEQGKGHPAIAKWLDPSRVTTDTILESIEKWRNEGRQKTPKKAKKSKKQNGNQDKTQGEAS